MTDSQERIFARSVYRHNHAVYAVAHARQLSRHLRVMTGHTAFHQRRRMRQAFWRGVWMGMLKAAIAIVPATVYLIYWALH